MADIEQRCSLEMMLQARDRRRTLQESHFLEHPDVTLVVATVVAPGEYKLTDASLAVARAEREALRREFGDAILSENDLDLPSGPETWLTLSCPPVEAKRKATVLEEMHPLGRLMDIDVIMPDLSPLPRTAIGLGPRKCLLCEREVRDCMRTRRHTVDEILNHIDRLIAGYI